MKQSKKKHPFEVCETGYHKHAVMELASWVGGKIEQPFYIDGQIVFIPDVVSGNILYEVVYTNSINGHKLGMIQAWSYYNVTNLDVYEISADYILKQKKIPDIIEAIEHYEININ